MPYRLAISLNGVNDGTRTHDNQCHKLALYQLNYVHHMERVVGIEPTFPAWKAGVLADIRYPQMVTPRGIEPLLPP